MNKKAVSGIMLTLLLIGMLTLAFNVAPATASLPVHNIITGEDFATIQEYMHAQDKYLIVTADNFYNNPKLREFTNWRLNEFDVEVINCSTILNEFPIPPTPDLLEIEELENMNTTIPDSRKPFIEAMWIDAWGKYHRFGHYKYNPYVTPPRSEYIKNEIASEPQAMFLIINRHRTYEGDEITLTYDGGNIKAISLPKMRGDYTRWTKLFVTIDGIPFFEKTKAHSILDYIKNVYENSSGKLKYVLLIGDVNLFPTFNMIYIYGSTPPTLVTDHFFTCIDDKDYAPEIAVGRLPANEATELEVMINKTVNYRPMSSNKFLMMEGFEAGELGDLLYEATRNVIISSLQSWSENPSVTELRKKNGDLTKSNIINAINSGQDFIIYCGHSAQTGWYNLGTSDMVSLDNETPSIAFAFSCLSGDYGYFTDCMGEAFLKDEDSGVTGYFGSSTPTSAGPTERLAEKLFQAIPYSDTIGEAILKSKVKYSEAYPLFHLSIFNLLGDPALSLCPDVAPPNITILSPENITYTTTSVPLTFTINEYCSWMGYSLDNQAKVTVTGNTTLTGLSSGVHSITVYANDTIGNMGASDTVYFTITLKTLLGTGWGWMRIDANESVYGRAELYKIEDEQIELVIAHEGNEYSRTWNIISHREYRYGERYICYSKKWGFLIVGLHKHRRWQFWYAVGKGVIAFGFPRFGRFRLMPI